MSQINIKIAIFIICYFLTANAENCNYEYCKCQPKLDSDETDIYCNMIAYFPRLLNKTQRYKNVGIFSITSNRFEQIPDDSFKDMAIDHLILGYNNMVKLAANSFRGIASLQKLRLFEERLTTFENKSLVWLKKSLVEFELWKINLSSNKLDTFMSAFKVLSNLKALRFIDNGLQNFKPEWLKPFKSLQSLSISSNKLEILDNDLFKYNPNMSVLDLTENSISNMTRLLISLKPLKAKLTDLLLGRNSIEVLPDLKGFTKLEMLDLSYNKIKSITENTLKDSVQLHHLYLSSNKLDLIETHAFSKLQDLITLDMNNNYLKEIPNIVYLNKLKSLDLSKQNDQLKNISDFSFTRSQPASQLNVDLNSNEIENFDSRSFCDSNLNSVKLSLFSMKNLNKCNLKQISTGGLVNSTVYVEITPKSYLVNYSDVCNCSFREFALNNKINLAGQCTAIEASCNGKETNPLEDDCNEHDEFSCEDEE